MLTDAQLEILKRALERKKVAMRLSEDMPEPYELLQWYIEDVTDLFNIILPPKKRKKKVAQ